MAVCSYPAAAVAGELEHPGIYRTAYASQTSWLGSVHERQVAETDLIALYKRGAPWASKQPESCQKVLKDPMARASPDILDAATDKEESAPQPKQQGRRRGTRLDAEHRDARREMDELAGSLLYLHDIPTDPAARVTSDDKEVPAQQSAPKPEQQDQRATPARYPLFKLGALRGNQQRGLGPSKELRDTNREMDELTRDLLALDAGDNATAVTSGSTEGLDEFTRDLLALGHCADAAMAKSGDSEVLAKESMQETQRQGAHASLARYLITPGELGEAKQKGIRLENKYLITPPETPRQGGNTTPAKYLITRSDLLDAHQQGVKLETPPKPTRQGKHAPQAKYLITPRDLRDAKQQGVKLEKEEALCGNLLEFRRFPERYCEPAHLRCGGS